MIPEIPPVALTGLAIPMPIISGEVPEESGGNGIPSQCGLPARQRCSPGQVDAMARTAFYAQEVAKYPGAVRAHAGWRR